MPSLETTLPHWAYWAGLIVFPLIAMILANRPRAEVRRYGLGLGYFILVTGGMLGLHRLYLRNLWGLVFIPVFLVILYANAQGQDARTVLSNADNTVRVAERILDRETERVQTAREDMPELRQALEEAEEGTFAVRRAERDIERAETRIAEGTERITQAERDLSTARPAADRAAADLARWGDVARWAFYVILAGLLLDAIQMRRLVKNANAEIPEDALYADDDGPEMPGAPDRAEDSRYVSKGWTGVLDRICLNAGEFVAYWAVIAVFVYYFEVISRYVFGSPTNWAHEAMYLMFGMQYLIAGAYAMLTEDHVRVDIFYAPLSRRRKAWVDLFTSVFFFIFAFTLLFTCYRFALDANAVATGNGLVSQWARGDLSVWQMVGSWTMGQWTDPNVRWGEISFNEWEVPLWPMKWVMVVGAVLLILQGISKFAQDIRAIREA